MAVNITLLKFYIHSKEMNLTEFAKVLGVNRSWIYCKFKKPENFTCEDVLLIKEKLMLSKDEVITIFFPELLI